MRSVYIKRLMLIPAIWLVMSVSCYLPTVFDAEPEPVLDPQTITMQQLQADSEKPIEISFTDGFPEFVSSSVQVEGADPAARAMKYLDTYADLYLLNNEDLDLAVHRVGGINGEDVVFYQTYKSIPIYASQIVVSLDGERVFASTGRLLSDISLEVTPTLSAQQAENTARQTLNYPAEAVVIGRTSLTIFDHSLIDASPPEAHLAWHVSFGSPNSVQAFVDAHNGDLLVSNETVRDFDYDLADAKGHTANYDCHWFTPEVEDIGDENGIFDEDYYSDPYATGIWRLGYDAYWFYFNRFNRDGFDDNGHELEVYIHTNPDELAAYHRICHSIDIPNHSAAYDIMVHEYTHGVIDFTSNFHYSDHSGALEESYADVMGIIADNDDWAIGDNTIGMDPQSIIHDIGSHTRDHISKYLYGSADNGGVHANSLIPSRAAYLIAAGGEHYGYKIVGIGREKMADLYYAVMISLPSSPSFAMAANATVARAQSWVGTGSWTQQDVCQIRNAFVAVGILEYGDADCDGVPNIYEGDADNDFILDIHDNCPYAANPNQSDNDGDGQGDMCDPDDDNDGVLDHRDNCQWISNPGQEDTEPTPDGIGDACEDNDYDNVPDPIDNCPTIPNSDQRDTDGDGRGDVCDLEDDGDGVMDAHDNCPWVDNPNQEDEDGDGFGDVCDNCPTDFNTWQYDDDGDGLGNSCDPDLDGDGVLNYEDNCILVYNPNQIDLDLDGTGFLCDDDEEPLLLEGSLDGSFFASPGDYFTLSIPACTTPLEDSTYPGVQHILTGLPSTVGTWITDQSGEMVARPASVDAVREMRFDRLGGNEYYLTFVVSQEFEDTQKVEFELLTNCLNGEQPPTQEAETPSSPTSTPTVGVHTPPHTVTVPALTLTSTFTPESPPSNTPELAPPTGTFTPEPPAPTPTFTPEPPANGWIDGRVWKDRNANGVKDSDEDWYAGVGVALGQGACTTSGYQTTTTGGDGAFTFSNVPPGEYCVSIDIPPACNEYSIPKTATETTIIVLPGAGSDAGLFGFAPYIC